MLALGLTAMAYTSSSILFLKRFTDLDRQVDRVASTRRDWRVEQDWIANVRATQSRLARMKWAAKHVRMKRNSANELTRRCNWKFDFDDRLRGTDPLGPLARAIFDPAIEAVARTAIASASWEVVEPKHFKPRSTAS